MAQLPADHNSGSFEMRRDSSESQEHGDAAKDPPEAVSKNGRSSLGFDPNPDIDLLDTTLGAESVENNAAAAANADRLAGSISFAESSLAAQEEEEPGDSDPLVDNPAPHHTLAAYPLLTWEIAALTRSPWTLTFDDRLVETEYIRYTYYLTGRSAIPLWVIVFVILLPHALSQSFPWITPMAIVLALIFMMLAVLIYLHDRKKLSASSYEAVCKNCRRQELLVGLAGVAIAISNLLLGPLMQATTSQSMCSLCLTSLRGLSAVCVPLTYMIQVAPRAIVQAPLLALQCLAFIIGWAFIADFSFTELNNNLREGILFACAAYLVAMVVGIIMERNKRDQFVACAKMYLEKAELESRKKLYCTFVSELLPPSALHRILRSDYVVDVALEATVTYTELFDFGTWYNMHSSQHVTFFINTLMREFDRRAVAAGLDKLDTRGDCYMTVCGLTTMAENHANRACTFALTLNKLTTDSVRRVGGHPISVRTGAHTGPMLGMMVGDRMRYDAYGRAQSIARQAAAAAGRGQCCATYPTVAMLNGAGFFHAEPTKKKFTVPGLDAKNSVAFLVTATEAWDPDSLVLPPPPVSEDIINFTERIRESFLLSTTNKTGALTLPDTLDIRSFIAYTSGGGAARDRQPVNDAAVALTNEFATISRVLKHQKRDGILERIGIRQAPDVEEAHRNFQSDPSFITQSCLGSSFVQLCFFTLLLIGLLSVRIRDDVAATILGLVGLGLGLAFIGAALARFRSSVVTDCLLGFFPWIALIIMLGLSDLNNIFLSRDPLFFRLFTALHLLAMSQRINVLVLVACDFVVNCVAYLIIVGSYSAQNGNGLYTTSELAFTFLRLIGYSLYCEAVVITRSRAEKRISAHRWVLSKIQRATKLECAVYTAVSTAAFPTGMQDLAMKWYLDGRRPELSVYSELGPQIVICAAISVRAVSLDDPLTAVGKLSALDREIERLLLPLHALMRCNTNGDSLLISGPRNSNDDRQTNPSLWDQLIESRLDQTLVQSVAFVDDLHRYGRQSGVSITCTLAELGNPLLVVLGDHRLSVTILGAEVSLARRVLHAAPDNGIFATSLVTRRLDRLSGQRINPVAGFDSERLQLPLVVGPISRFNVNSDTTSGLQVDMYQLTRAAPQQP